MGFVFPASVLFSLVLIIASLALFIVSKLKPNLYEESDNIYVVVGIVCGLLLLGSLELGAAMAFQQLLLISATITLMWRFINLRAENKQLKNRQAGTERPKAYNARLDDDRADAPRERGKSRRRRGMGYEEEERRLLGDSIGAAVEPLLSRRRGRSFDAEDAGSERYDERRNANISRQFSRGEAAPTDWDDDNDWNDRSIDRSPRRALPDADLRQARFTTDDAMRSPQRPRRERENRSADRDERDWNEFNDTRSDAPGERLRQRDFERDNFNEESAPRRRRNRSPRPERDARDRQEELDSRGAEGSMAGYVNYEPVDPPSGLPSSGSEPIVFPDRY